MERIRAQGAALADFGLFAFDCDDVDELLHRATELVSEALGVDLVKVLEHRPERQEMLIRAGVNWKPGVVGHVTFGDHEGSPGGYALKSSEPVISPDLSKETRFDIPQVLVDHGVRSMVNVIIAGKSEPFGVLEVDARSLRHFDGDDIAFLRNYANLLAGAIDRIASHDRLQRNAREQAILARELSHRVKNLLSLVQALASQTSTDGRTAEEFKEAFVGRLQALSAAESLVFEDREDTVDPRRIAEEVLAPHRSERGDAIEISGETAGLPSRKGRMLGLALHELATNAAKYGALSGSSGRVRVHWRLEPRGEGADMTLLWEESDGPEITPPQRTGFGTLLLTDIIGHELNGSSELDYGPAGLRFRLSFPVEFSHANRELQDTGGQADPDRRG